MNMFEYYEPKNLEEASLFLSKYTNEAAILAGGTDLIVGMRYKKKRPKYIANIKGITDLRYITYDTEVGLRIGSLSTIRDIEESVEVQNNFPLLKLAASLLGTPQIRNMGTLGGNLCNASPGADMAPPLIALGAKANIYRPKGNRLIDVEDFFIGPGQTVLTESEILREVQIPLLKPKSGTFFLKMGRTKAADLSIVNVAVMISTEKGRKCAEAKIVLGAVGPRPLRARKAEALLIGKMIDDSILEKASSLAAEEAQPITDVRGEKWYRREMVRVLTMRAIKTSIEKVG